MLIFICQLLSESNVRLFKIKSFRTQFAGKTNKLKSVNFSKSPNLWLHNTVTRWYHVDNHALSHITDSTDSS